MRHTIVPLMCVNTSDISISYKDNSFEWQLEAAVYIKSFKEIEDGVKVGMTAIVVSYSNNMN